jgi:hypothetical protein
MNKLFGCITLAVVALTFGGCATSRSTVKPTVAAVANPTEGTAIKIVTVVDQRTFEHKPSDPSIPSLGSESDLANPAITNRAIGRKRGGFGMALGDVLLPQGQTVTSLVQDAVANAYRGAGYRVLTKDAEGFDTAIPVDVKIKKFWCWDTPGFWQMSLENRLEVVITAPQPGFENGATVDGYAINHLMAIFEDEWPKIATASLADFNKNLQIKLKQKK